MISLQKNGRSERKYFLISNHGGRQLDGLATAMGALPRIARLSKDPSPSFTIRQNSLAGADILFFVMLFSIIARMFLEPLSQALGVRKIWDHFEVDHR